MNPKMTSYLSHKIKVQSLIAITMVIYIHTYYTEGEGYSMFMALQRFVGGTGLSSIANPLFYLTSGYLFFMGMKNAKECFPKIKKEYVHY
jgi:surface polysaccharide O-acyltransferase-like enzyme